MEVPHSWSNIHARCQLWIIWAIPSLDDKMRDLEEKYNDYCPFIVNCSLSAAVLLPDPSQIRRLSSLREQATDGLKREAVMREVKAETSPPRSWMRTLPRPKQVDLQYVKKTGATRLSA